MAQVFQKQEPSLHLIISDARIAPKLNQLVMNPQVDLLKDKLGFDDAFNYKEEPDLKSALKRSSLT